MTLGELRRGLLLTQSEIAGRLGVPTAYVATLEDEPARVLSANTLARYLEAFGGRLEAVIPAPGGTERRVRL